MNKVMTTWKKRGRGNLLVWIAFMGGLLIINFSHLTNPPYWDDLIGLHTQALWLADHNFNLFELWRQQSVTDSPCVYPLGVLPLLYALWYRCFTPETVHLLGHLLNMGCLATALTLMFRMVMRVHPWWLAIAATVTALTEPLVIGQSAALGQECPLLLLVVVSFYYFSRRRFTAALLWATAVFFIKFTGIILMMAYVTFWLLYGGYYFARHHRAARGLRYLAASVILLAAEYAAMKYFAGIATQTTGADISYILARAEVHLVYLLPLLPLLLACSVLSMIRLLWLRRALPFRIRLSSWTMFLYVGGFLLAYLLFRLPLPRYLTALIIPALLIAFIGMPRKAALVMALILIPLQIINWNGRFCSEMAERQRCGAYLERSREYLTDLKANLRLCRMLEQKASEHPVVAQWPFILMLTVPEMGYVERPLHKVYSATKSQFYRRNYQCYNNSLRLPADTLLLYAENGAQDIAANFNLHPGPDDLVVYSDNTMPGLLQVYIRFGKKMYRQPPSSTKTP